MTEEQKTPIDVFRCPCCGGEMTRDKMFDTSSEQEGDYTCGNPSCGISLTIRF